MNHRAILLGGSAAVLLITTVTLVVDPYIELRHIPPEDRLSPYTIEEARGRNSYVSLGCAYCHSQQPRDRNLAPDFTRGWGRASTPGDYAYDYPHQLGTMRTGPDLFNIGSRQPSIEWHLTHLYNPRAVVPESIMPGFPFLFQHKLTASPSDTVVNLPPHLAPKTGIIAARTEALDLAAYLVAMDHTYTSSYIDMERKVVTP